MELTNEKFCPHHSAACLPACPSNMAKKPCPRIPANGTTMECASSINRLGPLSSVTAHLKDNCEGKEASLLGAVTCLCQVQRFMVCQL